MYSSAISVIVFTCDNIRLYDVSRCTVSIVNMGHISCMNTPSCFRQFLARLYESTESYCCHPDVRVGVSVGVIL